MRHQLLSSAEDQQDQQSAVLSTLTRAQTSMERFPLILAHSRTRRSKRCICLGLGKVDEFADQVPPSRHNPLGSFSQRRLEPDAGLLDRVELGCVEREEKQGCPCSWDPLAHLCAFVAGEIARDDQAAAPELRHENLCSIDIEQIAFDLTRRTPSGRPSRSSATRGAELSKSQCEPTQSNAFKVLPRRWRSKCEFGWLGCCRLARP